MKLRRDALPPLDTPKLCRSEIAVLTLAYSGLDDREIEKDLGLKLYTASTTIKNARVKYRDWVQMREFQNMFKGRPNAPVARGLFR